MPTVVVRHPDGRETQHELVEELRIGRQADNDLVLAHGGVSRHHARLFVEAGEVRVEDAGSSNGTYVDDSKVEGAVPLAPESRLQLGDYELFLRAPRAKPAALARSPKGELAPRAPPRPGAFLKGLGGSWLGERYPVTGTLTVGRAAGSGLLIDDDSVSRRHAELEKRAGSFVVRDLGSANGTRLNGKKVGFDELPVSPGDLLQFGTVEFQLEAPSATPRPVRSSARRVPATVVEDDEGSGFLATHRRLVFAAGGVATLLFVAGLVKAFTATPRPPEALLARADGVTAAVLSDPAAELQKHLSECRSFATSEFGAEPKWDKAEAACERALDLDPIHDEAMSLIQRIHREQVAVHDYAVGVKALERQKEEEALDSFRKIPKDSEYFGRARPQVREAVARVTKRALEDCNRYLRDSRWSAAVPRCERYMGFACQRMSKEQLEPPMGSTLSLKPGRLGRNEWRPKDALYLKFLVARTKLDPQAPMWSCPVADMLVEDERPVDPKLQVQDVFKERFKDRSLNAAMMDYWSGRGNEAIATLQKLRIDDDRANLHAQADELMKDLSNVDQLFKTGQAALQAEDPERAAPAFEEVLEVDGRLMADLALTKPSFYRRNIQQDMASHAYAQGKHWADRGDERQGCRLWRLGFAFYAGNPTLNRAVGFCSSQGLQRLEGAQRCEDLAAVLDYAVKGDGLAEKVAAQKAEWRCP